MIENSQGFGINGKRLSIFSEIAKEKANKKKKERFKNKQRSFKLEAALQILEDARRD